MAPGLTLNAPIMKQLTNRCKPTDTAALMQQPCSIHAAKLLPSGLRANVTAAPAVCAQLPIHNHTTLLQQPSPQLVHPFAHRACPGFPKTKWLPIRTSHANFVPTGANDEIHFFQHPAFHLPSLCVLVYPALPMLANPTICSTGSSRL